MKEVNGTMSTEIRSLLEPSRSVSKNYGKQPKSTESDLTSAVFKMYPSTHRLVQALETPGVPIWVGSTQHKWQLLSNKANQHA